MATPTEARPTTRPDWLAAEMPPGYRNRLEELQRLSRELDELGRFGRLLFTTGSDLGEIVRETLTSFALDVTDGGARSTPSIVVKLDSSRRLLLHVSAEAQPIQRRGSDLAHVFQMIHEVAGNDDRVVLVANHDLEKRPADRKDGIEPDALALVKRLGANVLSGPTLFALWSHALQNRDVAREGMERLHRQDGGVFVLPASLTV